MGGKREWEVRPPVSRNRSISHRQKSSKISSNSACNTFNNEDVNGREGRASATASEHKTTTTSQQQSNYPTNRTPPASQAL